jgi:hypothetical protein
MTRKGVSLLVAGLLLLAMGCGSKGSISGTVTYNGKPITSGTIVFAPDSGEPSVNAPIADGKYTIDKVPPGPAKVGVSSVFSGSGALTPMQMALQKSGGKPPEGDIPEGARKLMEGASNAKQGVKIPDDYGDPSKSGLTYTVKGGKQTQDFDLK